MKNIESFWLKNLVKTGKFPPPPKYYSKKEYYSKEEYMWPILINLYSLTQSIGTKKYKCFGFSKDSRNLKSLACSLRS